MRRSRRLVLLAVLAAGLVGAETAPASTGAATIFFTKSTPREQTGQLWAVQQNGANPRILRRSMPIGPEGATATLFAGGGGIVCLCRPGEVNLIDTDGSHLRRIGSQPQGTRYDIVTLSSRGSAFWVHRANRILSQRANGKPGLVTRVKGAVIDERVVPSPAGNKVAFVQYGCLGPICPPGEAIQVRTVNVNGSGLRTVFSSSQGNREISDLEWSGDGTKLIFSSSTEFEKESPLPFESEYLVVGSDGSGPEVVAQGAPASVSNPFFSPDGTRLAVSEYSREKREQLFTIALDGSASQRIFRGSCRWPVCEFPPRVIGWTYRSQLRRESVPPPP